jgi:hypothetical protein
MKTKVLAAAIATAFLGLSSAVSAQSVNTPSTPTSQSAGASTGSPRCDQMTGAAKEQCVRDENTKTDSSTSGGSGIAGAGAGAPVPGTSIGTSSVPSGAGASLESSAGASGKCEKLTGNEKADCLRKEGLATSGSGGGSTDRPGPESTGMGR